jgi:hypothetical protein
MICPKCKNENPDDATYCTVCYEVFRKERQAEKATAPSSPPVSVPAAREPSFYGELLIPVCIAAAVAGCFAWRFRWFLPITEGWSRFETLLLPLSMADLAFHEAGHPIFGMLSFGNAFITAAGGTFMQLLIPAICLFEFWRRGSFAGILFVLFWIGENLAAIAFYAADAKQQVLILITGMSGAEGGMHDWGTMFGSLGLTQYSVGIGQTIFFAGCFLMTFAPAWGVQSLFRRFTRSRN